MESYALAAISVIFAGVFFGFFRTKTPGWGRYTTALLLLLLVLFVAGVAFAIGKIEWGSISGLIFAIAGYAGGILAPKNDNTSAKDQASQQ